jgi:hypothetical protein
MCKTFLRLSYGVQFYSHEALRLLMQYYRYYILCANSPLSIVLAVGLRRYADPSACACEASCPHLNMGLCVDNLRSVGENQDAQARRRSGTLEHRGKFVRAANYRLLLCALVSYLL